MSCLYCTKLLNNVPELLTPHRHLTPPGEQTICQWWRHLEDLSLLNSINWKVLQNIRDYKINYVKYSCLKYTIWQTRDHWLKEVSERRKRRRCTYSHSKVSIYVDVVVLVDYIDLVSDTCMQVMYRVTGIQGWTTHTSKTHQIFNDDETLKSIQRCLNQR